MKSTTMFSSVAKLSLLLALPVFLLSGCMSFNPKSLRTMEAALLESNPDMVIESTMKIGVGALTMDLVDFIFVHDRSIDVSKISRADVGIYELNSTLDVSRFRMPQADPGDRNCPQREVIVRIMEEDEHVEVAVCIRNEKITGMAVFVLEPKEIIVVNARGDFEGLVNSIVKGSMKKRRRSTEAQISSSFSQPASVASRTTHSIVPPT
jgi:hypothetical protein